MVESRILMVVEVFRHDQTLPCKPELVEKALQRSIPFRAVVADSFCGEDEGFKQSLNKLGVGYVLALKPSHAWWHKVGEIGSPYEAAVAAGEA